MKIEFVDSDEYKCPVCGLPVKAKMLVWDQKEVMVITMQCPQGHEWAVADQREAEQFKI